MSRIRRMSTADGDTLTAEEIAFLSDANVDALLTESKLERPTPFSVRPIWTIGRGEGEGELRSGAR